MKKPSFGFLENIKKKISNIFSKNKKEESRDSNELLSKEEHSSRTKTSSIQKKLSQFNPEHFFNSIFSVESRPSIHRGFLAIMMAIICYFSGRLIAISVRPNPRNISKGRMAMMIGGNPKNKEYIRTIRSGDLFKAEGEKIEPIKPDCKKNPNAKGCKKKPLIDKNLACTDKNSRRRSSLSIELLSTIVLQDSVKSVASVQIRGKKGLLNMREGEKVPRMARIAGIRDNKVIIKNLKTGLCEHLASKENKKNKTKGKILIERNQAKGKKIMAAIKNNGIKNQGNKFAIKKTLRDKMLSNISEVLTQARAIQIKNPDGSLSFRMQEIVPGSIYSKLNIKDGDVINGINGKKFTNINEIMSLFGQLKERDHYEISIARDGVDQTFEYDFE